MIYNYEPQTYHLSGGSTINDAKGSKQEGLLLRFRKDGKLFTMYLDKRDCARLAEMVKTGRKYWIPFRLPKMRKCESREH